MQKFFTGAHSIFLLCAAGIVIGVNIDPDMLQRVAASVGMTGLFIGMTKQAIKQYHDGKCGVHWILNTLMHFAVVLRGIYFLRTNQYWLAAPDIYGIFIMGIIQLQLAGYFLKKQNK